MRRDVHFPTILGVLVLLFGVVAGVFLISSKQLLSLRANPGEEPVYVTLSNVTDTAFSVSWITNVAVTGTVVYGTDENALSQRTADDRDQDQGTVASYPTHQVSVGKFRPLSPSTDYYFVIQSGSTVYDNSGKPYHVKTGPLLRGQASTDSVSGKVVHADGTPAEGAIVYLILPNAYPQSTLVTSSGNWIIPLGLSRSADLTALAVYDQQAAIAEIFVQGTGNGEASNASVVLTNARPTPLITLGQKYDWRTPGAVGQIDDRQQADAQPQGEDIQPTMQPRTSFGLEPLASPSAITQDVMIRYPGASENISVSRPAIIGTGPKGTKLSILIQSASKITGAVTIGSDGTWTFNVPADLPPGSHTVTATYTDALGVLKKVSKSFTVLAAESNVPAFVATPSATLAPTPVPTATPAPTAPPRVTLPSTGSGVPASGETTPTLLLVFLGLLVMGAGIFSWRLRQEVA